MNFLNFNVKRSNLLKFLTPTSKNTKWFESAPENKISSRMVGRFLLQFHQVANEIKNEKMDSGLKFLDIGTGNGILPELISNIFSCKSSVGLDPFSDGEHVTSHPKNTRSKLMKEINKYFKKGSLDFSDYNQLLEFESFSKIPSKVIFSKPNKKWKFEKKFINQLSTKKRFNFIFAKCIDHVPNWKTLFKNVTDRAEKNCTLLIKHNSFFSYNGAHRYSSTFIPWGHVLLSENNYKSYVKKFHPSRYKDMINFYYKGLAYPRYTLDELKIILFKNNWKILSIEFAPNKKITEMLKLAGGAEKLLARAKRRYKNISLSELISNRITIKAKKI